MSLPRLWIPTSFKWPSVNIFDRFLAFLLEHVVYLRFNLKTSL